MKGDELEEQILKELIRQKLMYEIELEPDIYCVGFLTFLRSNSPKKLEQIIFKCIWTFVIQMILLTALIYSFCVESLPGGGTKWKGIVEDIYVGNPSLNMSRITCAFLLHVSIVPEIKTAKEIISFTKKNPTMFSGQRFEYAIMIGMFKFLGGVASFAANILLCVVSQTIDDVIKDFVAVMIIN